MKTDSPGSPAPVAMAASTPSAAGEVDAFVGQPCPLCGKGTIIKGKTAYGCSEWKMDVLSGRISNFLHSNEVKCMAEIV